MKSLVDLIKGSAKVSPQPPRKRPRSESVTPSRSSSPVQSHHSRDLMPSPSSPSPQPSGDEGDDEDASDYESGPAPPKASRGWQLCPSFWDCNTVGGVAVAKVSGVAPERQPDVVKDIVAHMNHGVTSYWFRPKGKVKYAPPSQRELVSNMPYALASITPWLLRGQQEGEDPGLSICLAGSGKKADGCEVVSGSISPSLSLASLSSFWSSKVAGDKRVGTGNNDFSHDPLPFKQSWPEGSIEEKVFTFLRNSQDDEGRIPGGLSVPQGHAFKKDRQARASAHRLLQASANLDLIISSLKAAHSSLESWSMEDVKAFLAVTIKAQEGVGALFAPHTREAVREAVSQRIALREEAIPKRLSSLRQKLLSLNPLSPYLFGGADGVSTIINSKPPPAEIDLRGLTQLVKSSQPKGQGQNKANPPRSGNKNQGGKGKGKGPNKGKGQGQSTPSNNKKPFHGGQGKNYNNNKGPSAASSGNQKAAQKRN